MIKKDFKKELKEFYNPSAKEVSIVDVPSMNFVMIDGKGDPNTSKEFQAAIEALYKFSYTLKFKIKKGKEAIDYGVLPLEGLWWADNMDDFLTGNKKNWFWTIMIAQPYIDDKIFADTIAEIKAKKDFPKETDKLRLESYTEGKSVQIMHIGPFSAEGPNIKRLHDKIAELGKKPNGKHHEIYLSDMRRTAPEKLKTVVRQSYK